MKFNHHKYEYINRFENASHHWSLLGPAGGVEFHANALKGLTSCGLEIHASRSGRRNDRAPDHLECYLTKEPCWHEGTSLYATETLWPNIEHHLKGGDHEAVWRILELEYDRYFGKESE
ncbi:MAG: hypothetical protein H6829_09575 [Planctomycetes bacterium]|nr:hypothetical protein [Planctomycetota bacterium]